MSQQGSKANWFRLFGPVLSFDMIRQARRRRFIALRFLYCLLLAIILIWMVLPVLADGLDLSGADFAERYFEVFLVLQLGAVTLLTPAFVAGSIADEKERKTLEFMLATDLGAREIVLSKLGSRLANLGLFLLTGLPILGFLQFLGGVDPNLVFAAFALAGLTAASEAGISILFSVVCKRASDAIIRSYCVVILYSVANLVLASWAPRGVMRYWFGEPGAVLDVAAEWINTGNLLAVYEAIGSAAADGTLADVLPGLIGKYALFHGSVALVCTGLAIWRLRRDGLADLSETLTADHARLPWRRHPRVSDNAMLWKEVHCEKRARSWFLWLATVALVGGMTFIPPLLIVHDHLQALSAGYDGGTGFTQSMNVWVRICNVAVGSLTLLGVAVRAATSITRERAQQTWDTLLTTPVGASKIAHAKWWGSILGLRWGMLWLALIWAVAVVTGGMSLFALPIVVWTWLGFAFFSSALGLWFSVICKTSTQATIWTVLSTSGLAVGHWAAWLFCLISSTPPGLRIAWFQACFLTPPFVLGVVPLSAEDLTGAGESEWSDIILGSCVSAWLWGFLGWCLANIAAGRLKSDTHENGAHADRPSIAAASQRSPRL